MFPHITNAQDWQLFPLGQVNYYQADDEIMEFCFDSVVVNGDKHTYYSRSLRNYSIYENCDSSLINSEYISFLFPKPRINIYSMSNDTIIYEFDRFGKVDATRVIFIPLNLSINDTFKCNQNITIICYAKVYKDILKGIKDSVKYFEFSQNGKIISEIELSKNYGLIQFFDFHVLYKVMTQPNLQLIGIKIGNKSFGCQVKKINIDELFEMGPGDEKYWIKYEYGELSYTKDKLIELKNSVNNIKMKYAIYDRKNFDKFGQQISNESIFEYYQRESFKKILENRENIFFTNYLYLETDINSIDVPFLLLHDGGDYMKINDSTLTFGFNPLRVHYQGIIVENDCKLSSISDIFGYKIYYPFIGLAYWKFDNLNFGCTYKLIGFKINGEIFGDVPDFLTSTEEISENKVFIFPNPVSEKLTISNIPDGAASFKIYNLFGERVLSVETIHELSLQNIDVSSLPTGVYFLKLNNQPPVKFVKL